MNEDKAARFHRLQRRCFWTALGIQTIGLLVLVAGGWSQRVRDAALALTGGTAPSSIATVIVFTIMLLALLEILGAPERFYRTYILERRYGLSDIPLALWVSDYTKGRALGAALGLAASIAVYLAMAIAPERWWMIVATLGVLFLIVAARLLPSVFLPMFYAFKPLDRDSLRERIESLSRRANVPVLGIYEWGLGDKTRRANAALVGTGRGRRILLSDTLLSQYTDDEIEVILAHEMGHHAHRDIRNGLMLEAVCIVLICATSAVGTARGVATARPGESCRRCRVAVVADDRGSGVARDDAVDARLVAAQRASRRSFCPDDDRASRRVCLRHAAPGRPEPRRRAALNCDAVALSQPPAVRAEDSSRPSLHQLTSKISCVDPS